jgi:hypothetical protein
MRNAREEKQGANAFTFSACTAQEIPLMCSLAAKLNEGVRLRWRHTHAINSDFSGFCCFLFL